LTGTSPYSGWVEQRSLLNSANKWVVEAIEDIRASLPFPLTAGHYDNGMEFINKPLLEWCLAKHIKASRSRPYRKNDNCFAEQKNYDAVRKTVGYFRFDSPPVRRLVRPKRSDFGWVLVLRNQPLFG
jgi:hypothetical protein